MVWAKFRDQKCEIWPCIINFGVKRPDYVIF